MKRSWIGSLASLTLGLICAVALSTAPLGCSQNKGSATQVKSGQSCEKVEGKCPKDCKCGKDCKDCKWGKDCKCGEDCKCAKKAAGECPHAEKKPCPCKKTEGK